MKFKIQYVDQVVGVISLLALAAVIVLLFSIGSTQRWFSQKHYFESEFDTAANLTEGMSISYKGFAIGKIAGITLSPMNTVSARLYIYHDYYDRVTEGSILDLSVSPIGLGTQLLFYPGNSSSLLAEGAFIPRRDSPDGRLLIASGMVTLPGQEDTINALIGTVGSVLATIDNTLKGSAETPITELIGTITGTLAEVQNALAGTDSTALGRTIGGLAATAENAASLLETPEGLVPRLLKSDSSVSRLFNDQDELYNSITDMLGTVDSTLVNIDGITGSLDNDMPQVEKILTEVQMTLIDVQGVLEGLQNNPLLKGGITQKPEAQGVTSQLRPSDF
ncbi:MAG: MlaD family protein [Spirochaetaceae bacterium]|nr:MlaD family protein [Spirochaetaceae bacterium]